MRLNVISGRYNEKKPSKENQEQKEVKYEETKEMREEAPQKEEMTQNDKEAERIMEGKDE
jgi:hypothetical protein